MVDLLASFSELPPTSSDSDIYVARLISSSSHVRIARDSDGNPTLLVAGEFDDRSRGVPIELRNLTYLPSCTVEISDAAGGSQTVSVSLLKCESEDWALRRHFLRVLSPLVDDFGDAPKEADVSDTVRKVVELFRAMDAPATTSLQGLWCELLLIDRSVNVSQASSAWHSTPGALFDFSAESQNVEVKSTRGLRRTHHFSLEQTLAVGAGEVLVASFMLDDGGTGLSIGELWDQIRARNGVSSDILHRLDRVLALSLGKDWRMANKVRFDPERALNSLRLYEMDDVPRVQGDVPAEVTEVRFRSDLTDVTNVPFAQVSRKGGVFLALFGGVGGGKRPSRRV